MPTNRDEIRRQAEALTVSLMAEAMAALERSEQKQKEKRERSKWRRLARKLQLARILKRKR